MEKPYTFRQRLLQLHRPHRRMPKPCGKGQIEITAAWHIAAPGTPFLRRCAEDLQDYFKTSMELDLPILDGTASDFCISYRVDPTLEQEGAYGVVTTEKQITLVGRDLRAAAQASYLLEDLLNLEEAPYLTPGTEKRCPLFRCRMIHSGYGEDDFPDQHLAAIAHSGINAILVFVKGVDQTLTHALDFNDLIARAQRYGLDVYAYSGMQSRLHPDDPHAAAFYDALYGELFRRCPGFKGIVFVGESIEFPSKDPRTSGMLRLDNKGPDGKRLVNKPNPGWFPCLDYPQWLDMVKNTIRREKPDADIVFWTYNWGGCAEEDRLALIDRLPTDISLQATFEMFENGQRQGVATHATDYTLSFPGPGDYFVSEAKAAAKRGIPLYAMTNAAGLTWDVGVVPFEPAPYQWLKRYEGMRQCHEAYGLCGSMDSHHYGFTPSFISDLTKIYFTTESPDGAQIIKKLIARDWGAENIETVEVAYRLFSDAIHDLITSNRDQYGPLRIGPAYPLVLFDDEDIQIPNPTGMRHGGNIICNPHYKTKTGLTDPAERLQLDGAIRVIGSCAKRMLQGAEMLTALLPTLPQSKRDEAARVAGVAAFIGRTLLTTHHVKRWYKEKMAILHHEGDLQAHINALRTIGALETENARATLPLVDADSRLGFEPSMGYIGDRPHLEWKIAVMEKILREELPRLEKMV